MEEIEGSIWVTANIQQGACQQKCPQLQAFHDAIVSGPADFSQRTVTGDRQIALWFAGHNRKSSMPSAKHILLVDDETVPRHSLAEQLTREGNYAVIEAGSAAEARAAGDYHFAIIDLAEGEALARDLRQDGFAGPVLFLGDGATGERLAKPFPLS